MKIFILFLCLFFHGFCKTNSIKFEYSFGFATLHYYNPGGKFLSYKGAVTEDGNLILNPIIGMKLSFEKSLFNNGVSFFSGLNSVGGFMIGGFYEAGIKIFKDHLYINGISGFYIQSDSEYRNYGYVPFKLFLLGDTDIVPIIGINFSFKLDISKYLFIKLNSLVTPILINFSISFGSIVI